MDLAPVAVFAFDRPDHLRRTLQALARNELAAQTEVVVYSDGPRSDEDAPAVDAVRRVAGEIRGFGSIRTVERPSNLGLATSITTGVSETCDERGRVIVVEDDLVTSPYFLRFLNDALVTYSSDPEVVCVSGFTYPHRRELPETFFLRGAYNLGWATWSSGWACFDPDGARLLRELRDRDLTKAFDVTYFPYTKMLEAQVNGEIDSWAIRWYASAFLANRLTLFHGDSLVRNIGFDGSGTNVGDHDVLAVPLATDAVDLVRIPLEESPEARRAFRSHLRGLWVENTRAKVSANIRRAFGR